jgi:hypothetical protein
MKDLVRYKSFDELKASSEPIDTDVERVRERHKQFAEAIHFLRSEYIHSSESPDDDAPVNTSTANGLR